MNVLITSVGRRAYLVEEFRGAISRGDSLCGADCDPHAPALELFDRAFLIPQADDPEYADALLRLCDDIDIHMIVPVNDLELPVLAREKEQFAARGTYVMVSDPAVVEVCFDKFKTFEFLTKHALPAPKTYAQLTEVYTELKEGRLSFPLLVKPRRGSASMGIVEVRDVDQLEQEWHLARRGDDIVQEHLGTNHFSLHLFCDQPGTPTAIIGLKVLYKKRGECYKAVTTDDPALLSLGERLADCFPIIGPWCVDVMATENGYAVIEINPRLGGGYPVSHFAGADFPRRILTLAHGGETKRELFPSGVVMLKQYVAMRGETGWAETQPVLYGTRGGQTHLR